MPYFDATDFDRVNELDDSEALKSQLSGHAVVDENGDAVTLYASHHEDKAELATQADEVAEQDFEEAPEQAEEPEAVEETLEPEVVVEEAPEAPEASEASEDDTEAPAEEKSDKSKK